MLLGDLDHDKFVKPAASGEQQHQRWSTTVVPQLDHSAYRDPVPSELPLDSVLDLQCALGNRKVNYMKLPRLSGAVTRRSTDAFFTSNAYDALRGDRVGVRPSTFFEPCAGGKKCQCEQGGDYVCCPKEDNCQCFGTYPSCSSI